MQPPPLCELQPIEHWIAGFGWYLLVVAFVAGGLVGALFERRRVAPRRR